MEKALKTLQEVVELIKAEPFTSHREMVLVGLQTALDNLPKHVEMKNAKPAVKK